MTGVDPQAALIDECNRQSENCAYSATTFIIWLRVLRIVRLFCVVAPIVCGALAAWKVMADSPAWAATWILLATAIPPAYRASPTDRAIADYQTLAGEMTNLRDRFRYAATIDSHKPFAEFDAVTKPLLDRLEKARARALTPPEWCFRSAWKKHKAGHYVHDYDQSGTTKRMGSTFSVRNGHTAANVINGKAGSSGGVTGPTPR